MMPTAEQWLLKHKTLSVYDVASYDEGGYAGVEEEAVYKIMVEFAKFHCEAQAKVISEKAKIAYDVLNEDQIYIDKNSILTAYPLENIK